MAPVQADEIDAPGGTLTLSCAGRTAALLSVPPAGSDLILGDGTSAQATIRPGTSAAPVVDRRSLVDPRIAFVATGENAGLRHGYSNEPHWEIAGGALHLTHVNANTGGELTYIMRVGHNDELEIVRRVAPVDRPEFYEEITRFGLKRDNDAPITKDRGIVELLGASTWSAAAADTEIRADLVSFLAYREYTLTATLDTAPLTAAELSAPGVHAAAVYRSAPVAPGADAPHHAVFSRSAGGDAIAPGTVYWISAVVSETGPNGLTTVHPRTFRVQA